MTEPLISATPEAAPALACPKCGHENTDMTYCDGCNLRPMWTAGGSYADDRCNHGDLEHNHRWCKRCSYRWRTDDVINARKVCAK